MRGLYTLVQSALREHVLAKVHYGHLAIVKIKQDFRGLVWWQDISRYLETMVDWLSPTSAIAAAAMTPNDMDPHQGGLLWRTTWHPISPVFSSGGL